MVMLDMSFAHNHPAMRRNCNAPKSLRSESLGQKPCDGFMDSSGRFIVQ
jgi:hypothetical protein